jgi:hypothetical protein
MWHEADEYRCGFFANVDTLRDASGVPVRNGLQSVVYLSPLLLAMELFVFLSANFVPRVGILDRRFLPGPGRDRCRDDRKRGGWRLRISFIERHLGLYGGIRPVLELASRFVDRGDAVPVYHPTGFPCAWMECRAAVRAPSALGGTGGLLKISTPCRVARRTRAAT